MIFERKLGFSFLMFLGRFNSLRSAAVSFSVETGADNNLCIHWQWNHAFLLIQLLTVKWLVCYRDKAIWQHLKIPVRQRLRTILMVSIKASLTPIVGWWICSLLFITFLYLHLFVFTVLAAWGFYCPYKFPLPAPTQQFWNNRDKQEQADECRRQKGYSVASVAGPEGCAH